MDKTRIALFAGVPLNDAALIYRTGLLAKELEKRNFEARVFCLSFDYYGAKKEEILDGVKIHFVGQAHYSAKKSFGERKTLSAPRLFVEIIKSNLRLRKELKKFNPKIVHVFTSLPTSMLTALFLKMQGFNTMVDVDDLSSAQAEKAGLGKIQLFFVKFLEDNVPKMFKVSVCSHFLNKKFKKSVLIPNMIDLKEFDAVEKKNLRKKFGLKKTIVSFVGRIAAYHGQLEILDIVEKISKKHDDVSFLFVGGGTKFDSLKNEIAKRNLESCVVCTGYVSKNETIQLLKMSQIGILPMKNEPVHLARNPLKLLEYFASGNAVVSNKVGDVEKIVKHMENGWLGKEGNMEDIEKGIELLVSNEKLRRKLAENGLETVKGFSVEKIIGKWMEFYGKT